MSKRGDPFNQQSHSKHHYPYTQSFTYESQTPQSNKKSTTSQQQSNDTNQELNRALRHVEVLKAEKNQLKDALRAILERRSSESFLHLNISNNFKPSELISPSKASVEGERALQRENNELRDELRRCNEQLTSLRQENEGYTNRLEELERINNANLRLKGEMEKITGELAGLASNEKHIEDEKEHRHMSGSRFGAKAAKYINYTLDLIENYDPSHFLRRKFDSRFENAEKIQELLDGHQFDALAVQAFKYISDLVANSHKADNSPKQEIPPIAKEHSLRRNPREKATPSESTALKGVRRQSPVTSAFEANIPRRGAQHSQKASRSRNASPQKLNVGASASEPLKFGHDSSRALKKIITNISTFPARSKDNTRRSSPQSQERPNAEPRFVIDTPRETAEGDAQSNSPKITAQQKEQRVVSPGLQAPIQKQGKRIISPKSPSETEKIQPSSPQQQHFYNFPQENPQSKGILGQYPELQRPQSPVAQGSNKYFFYRNPHPSQVPVEFMGQFGSGYFPQQQGGWIKSPHPQDPQFNRRQSEQVSTGIPVTSSGSFLSNYSPRTYEPMMMQGQNSPQNKFYYVPPQQFSRASPDPNELSSPHPYDINPPQPHAYQPSPSHQRYYQMPIKSPQMFNPPGYPQQNFNRGEIFVDKSASQNVQETQDSSNHRILTNESHLSGHFESQGVPKGQYHNDPNARQYDARNDIVSYRSSDSNIASPSYAQEFIPVSPTHHSGQSAQRRVPGLEPIDRTYPQNDFVRGPDGKIYGQGYASSPQGHAEMLSPNQYSNTPYFISAKPRQNFEVIPEESERHNHSDTKQKQDKQTQAKSQQSLKSAANNLDNLEVINCKGTQTGSVAVTPSSKLSVSSKRENIPSLNFDTLQKNKDRLVVPPIQNDLKNPNPQQRRGNDNSRSITPNKDHSHDMSQGTTPLDSSAENSIMQKNHHKKTPGHPDHEHTPAQMGRATLGVMGNQEAPDRSNKKSLNASADLLPSAVNSSHIPSTFRVSFGKTQSLMSAEKPRFDIAPNDTICIVEVPRKKHINLQRKFDIITNEKKPLPVTPTSTNKTPGILKQAHEVSINQFPTTQKTEL